MAKRTRKGQKQCPKCDAWVKGTRAKKCPKCGYGFTAAKAKKAARQAVTASSRGPDQGHHCRHVGADQGGRRDGEERLAVFATCTRCLLLSRRSAG